jgi:hypothetical protein
VAGVGVDILVAIGSRPTIGSSLVGLQLLQRGLVLLAALMGRSVLVGNGSVTDITVVVDWMDALEAVVWVGREDVGHVDSMGRAYW